MRHYLQQRLCFRREVKFAVVLVEADSSNSIAIVEQKCLRRSKIDDQPAKPAIDSLQEFQPQVLVKVNKVTSVLCAAFVAFSPKSINPCAVLIILTAENKTDVPIFIPHRQAIRERAGMRDPADSNACGFADKGPRFVEIFVQQTADHRVQLSAISQV